MPSQKPKLISNVRVLTRTNQIMMNIDPSLREKLVGHDTGLQIWLEKAIMNEIATLEYRSKRDQTLRNKRLW